MVFYRECNGNGFYRDRWKESEKVRIGGKRDLKPVICLLIGICFYFAAEWKENESIQQSVLQRGEYGEGERQYDLIVEGLKKDSTTEISLTIGEKVYSEEKVRQTFEEEYERLCKSILGKNLSLDQVRYPLDLEEDQNRENRGIRFTWRSDHPEIMDPDGQNLLSYQEQGGRKVCLSVDMTDGIYSQSYDIPITVFPPEKTEEEIRKEFLKFLKTEDEIQQTQDSFVLPKEYEGERLVYQKPRSEDSKLFLWMGVSSAMAFYFQKPIKERENKKKREQQMAADYSQVVSKLLVLVGAGFTIRAAWEKIVKDYEKKKKQHVQEVRYVYEEMAVTYAQITSGVYESKAYREFGRRCGLLSYMKLGCLLEQNLRTGTKHLRELLEEEMEKALEERKQIAKKRGEEASTKLLLPMIMMMGIVMVIVVVPAFMSM